MRRETITLGELVGVGVSLVIIGLVFTFGINIVSDIRNQYGATTQEYVAANDTMRGMAQIPSKLPTIALIIAVAVIISILLRSFMGNK
jgi:hypothetical protein